MITDKILVVDDEKTVCDSIGKILSRKGYKTDSSLSGEEALEKLKLNEYDLVITDLMMPKMSGIELLDMIKKYYPELEVLIVTGYASIDTAVKATKLGAYDYLPKPFTPDELFSKAIKAIERKKVRPEKAEVKYLNVKGNIDVDMPFDEREVEHATSKQYVDHLTRSDVPQTKKEQKSKKTEFCVTGQRECAKLVKDGMECEGECPIEKKARERAAKMKNLPVKKLDHYDADMPFSQKELQLYMSDEYMSCLDRGDMPRAALYGRRTEMKHNVLVVDDEPVVCNSVRKILAKTSCKVEEAFDLDSAIAKMRINKYDLVLLDLRMPKRDGLEILEIIKMRHPRVPVIMITGYATIETAIEATRLGAQQYLPKPFTPDELTKAAKEAMLVTA